MEKNENECVFIKSILSDTYWQNGISEKHERRMIIRGMDRNASGFLFCHGSGGPFGHFINKVTVPVFSKLPLSSYSPPAAFDLCPVPFCDSFDFSRNDFL